MHSKAYKASRLLLACLLTSAMLLVLAPSGRAQVLRDGSFEAWENGDFPTLHDWDFMGHPDRQVLDGEGPGILGVNTPPLSGEHYLGLHAHDGGGEEIGQAIQLEEGTHYYGQVGVFRSAAHASWNGRARLVIWGSFGGASMAAATALWTSEPVENLDQWAAVPIAFTPQENFTYLSLQLVFEQGSGDAAYVCVDDFYLSTTFFGADFFTVGAQVQENGILVQWTTAPLVDETMFTVEGSHDGEAFTEVGSLQGEVAAEAFAYQVQGSQPRYLRVRSTDLGGRQTLSEVVFVNALSAQVAVFPNPSNGSLDVSLPTGMGGVKALLLHDATGRLIWQSAGSGLGTQHIDLPGSLPAGNYLLSVQAQHGVQRQWVALQR